MSTYYFNVTKNRITEVRDTETPYSRRVEGNLWWREQWCSYCGKILAWRTWLSFKWRYTDALTPTGGMCRCRVDIPREVEIRTLPHEQNLRKRVCQSIDHRYMHLLELHDAYIQPLDSSNSAGREAVRLVLRDRAISEIIREEAEAVHRARLQNAASTSEFEQIRHESQNSHPQFFPIGGSGMSPGHIHIIGGFREPFQHFTQFPPADRIGGEMLAHITPQTIQLSPKLPDVALKTQETPQDPEPPYIQIEHNPIHSLELE